MGQEINVSVQNEPETKSEPGRPAGLGEAGRPLTATIGATQPLPTFRSNPERPCKGGGHTATSPGRPA